MDEFAESDEDEGRASMRAWRFVPEPEMRTTRRRGSVEDVACDISEDMTTDRNEMVVWRELERDDYFCRLSVIEFNSNPGSYHQG